MEESTVIRERQRVLFGAVDRLLVTHREWIDSDAMTVTEAFGNAVTGCHAAFEVGMIPGKCRALNDRVAELMVEWQKWDADNQLSRHETLPGNSFWKCLRNLQDARKAAEPRPPIQKESIAELVAQGVSEGQIARIYEWLDEDGTAQIWKVREEKAQPGKHTRGISPAERLRKQREDKETRELQAQQERLDRKVKAVNAAAPEGLAKLVEDGVSAQQIAMLLKLDDAEAVFAECDKAGIPRPPMNYDITAESAEPGVAISDEDKAEIDAILDEAGRPMTLEQAIVTCYLEGKNVAQITSQLTRNDQPLTRKKVTAVLRRYRQDPEAFGQIPAPVSVAAAEEEEFDGINPFEDDGE